MHLITSLKEILSLAKGEKKIIAVAAAEDKDVLVSLTEAERHGLASFLLFGREIRIREILEENNLRLRSMEIFDCPSPEDACREAARAVSEDRAQILMKGMADTSMILKAVLQPELHLKKGELLSHVMLYEMDAYPKLILLTDGGMVVNPSLADKIDLIANTAVLGELLGIKPLKVAVLSAVEKVNTHFKSSLDAHELALHYVGDPRFLVEGPLSFDIAVSKASAQHKGVGGEVPGDADVLLVPSLEAGNFLGKSFTYMAGAQSAGIILGARCPIVLTSRSDSSEAKLSSIALAVLLSRMTPPM